MTGTRLHARRPGGLGGFFGLKFRRPYRPRQKRWVGVPPPPGPSVVIINLLCFHNVLNPRPRAQSPHLWRLHLCWDYKWGTFRSGVRTVRRRSSDGQGEAPTPPGPTPIASAFGDTDSELFHRKNFRPKISPYVSPKAEAMGGGPKGAGAPPGSSASPRTQPPSWHRVTNRHFVWWHSRLAWDHARG